MGKILYIKYGELNLKGKNKITFVNQLHNNIKNSLIDYNVSINKEFDSTSITFNDDNYHAIIEILKFVPGIQYIILAHTIERDLDLLEQKLVEYIDPNKTFKISCRRKDKTYPLNSREITIRVAGFLLTKYTGTLKVDVHCPDQDITLEIKQNTITYYMNKIHGIGGFPVGINGKVLVLLSGGIDSPVASCLVQKKGIIPHYITFITPPHTSEEALNKVRDLIKIITLDGKISRPHLFAVNFTPILHEITHIKNESYKITIMRRIFFRIADEFAKHMGYFGIVTGESIGQVASQTMESMGVISSSIQNQLILRPLLCMDKSQIIKLAKKYKTYETSILPYDDSCSLFAPKKPTTKPKLEKAEKLEKDLYMLEPIIKNTIENLIKGDYNDN